MCIRDSVGVELSLNFLHFEIQAVIPFLSNKSPNGKQKITVCVGAFFVTCKLIPYCPTK